MITACKKNSIIMACFPTSTLILACLIYLTTTQAANILFLLPLATPSHSNFLLPLLQNLSKHHHVTVSTSSPPFTVENVTFVRVDINYSHIVTYMNSVAFTSMHHKPFESLIEIEKLSGPLVCKALFESKFFQDKISAGFEYDIVFANSAIESCSVSFAQLLSKNIIYLNFLRHLMPAHANNFHLASTFAVYPNVISHHTATMTFLDRMRNFLMSSYWIYLWKLIGYDSIMKDYRIDVKSVEEASSKVAFAFTNSDTVLSEPIPSSNFVIKIGGMHLRKPKPVPKELEIVLDKSDGFIFFSMGTVADLSSAGKNMTLSFIEAFGRLKETVIWKTSENFTNLPSNVKPVKWLPQQDVLGHPKIRLFISQGGIFGMQEAVYHGVPILGNPFFTDQFSNIRRVEELGIGKGLHFESNSPSADLIYKAIREIIDDPRFTINVKKYSRISHDEINNNPPLDKAIFWTEYLLRHSDLRTHFRYSNTHLNFLEYFMVDVVVFLLTGIWMLWKILKLLFKCLRNS